MNFSATSLLGLAVSDRAIVCAQLTNRGVGRRVVRRLATFEMPAGTTLDQPDALGQALASFLRQHGFGATRAVVGVPAKWLIAAERDVPPADTQATRAMLRLQAERIGGAEGGELLFDYVDADGAGGDGAVATAARGGGGKVLLVGILRRQLQRVERTLDAAGLTVVAVTSTALALAWAMNGGGDDTAGAERAAHADASMLMLGRGGGEVVWRHHGMPRMLRHVPVSSLNGHGAVAMTALGNELRRAVALAPTPVNGKLPATAAPSTSSAMTPPVTPAERRLLLWDLVGLSESDVRELSGRLGADVRSVTAASALGLEIDDDASKSANGNGVAVAAYAPAMALALAGASRRIPLDLAHSRLVPPPQRKVNRVMVWSVAIGVTLLIAIGSLFITVQQRQSESAQLKQQLTGIAQDRKDAQQNVDRINYGRQYFDQRSPVLECLRELTLAFRDNEPIYVSTLTLRENGVGQVSGKSPDQRYVLALADRMRGNPKFVDVGKVDWRGETNTGGGGVQGRDNRGGGGGGAGAGNRDRDGTFSISFSYREPSAPAVVMTSPPALTPAPSGAARGPSPVPNNLPNSQVQQRQQQQDRRYRRGG